MSNIDAQIKALLLKKKKIDYVSYVADLIKNDTHCIDFKEVQDEVVSKIEPFLLGLMDAIENDTLNKTAVNQENQLSPEQLSALKLVADKVLSKPSTPQQSQTNTQNFSQDTQSVAPQKPIGNVQDKMQFAMNNRHLANVRVQVLNDQNAQIFGTVVGLDAPHVVVKTETGPTILVPIEKVVPQ
jgi:hypothetical protein